jgi:hypothetical protein
MVASSRFRYSAPLVPWSDVQLDRLHMRWISLAKAAWKVPPGFPAAPLKFPTSQAGSPVPHPRVYLVQALATHIEQLVALPDALRDRTIWQYRQLCRDTGCNTARELADLLACERYPRECPIARLLRACGQLDVAIKLPDCLSLGPGENETSWYGLYMQIRNIARADGASEESRRDFETVRRSWSSLRLALGEKRLPPATNADQRCESRAARMAVGSFRGAEAPATLPSPTATVVRGTPPHVPRSL